MIDWSKISFIYKSGYISYGEYLVDKRDFICILNQDQTKWSDHKRIADGKGYFKESDNWDVLREYSDFDIYFNEVRINDFTHKQLIRHMSLDNIIDNES